MAEQMKEGMTDTFVRSMRCRAQVWPETQAETLWYWKDGNEHEGGCP